MVKFKRVAKSLTVLRNEVNLTYPGRPTGSDGALGDTKHAARVSDHNPNNLGIVCALDLTEWTIRGVEMNDVLAEFLRMSRDPRIKYVISDGRMFSSYGSKAWLWRKYEGVNDHTRHVHVSVWNNYDDTKPWGFKKANTQRKPVPVIPLLKKDEQMEILNPTDSDKQYLHIIGTGIIHLTDGHIEAQYKKTYPEIACNEAWVGTLTEKYN